MTYNYLDLLVSMPRDRAPSTLWHYTNIDGLIGIIKSKTLFATEMSYLNDEREFHLAADLLIDDMFEAEGKERWGLPPDARSHIQTALEKIDKNVCVASFCTQQDLLSQWRGYGKGQRGISLGFDSQSLKKLALPHYFDLVRCSYGERKQRKILFDGLQPIIEKYEQIPAEEITRAVHLGKVAEELAHWLKFLAPLIKDAGFEEEDEYRLVGPLTTEGSKHLDIRRAGDALVCHCPLPITSQEVPCPLTEILIGPPASDFNKMKRSVTVLLERYWPESVGIKISNTRIPYRSNS